MIAGIDRPLLVTRNPPTCLGFSSESRRHQVFRGTVYERYAESVCRRTSNKVRVEHGDGVLHPDVVSAFSRLQRAVRDLATIVAIHYRPDSRAERGPTLRKYSRLN